MSPKCSCRNCNGHIEFDPIDLGRTVSCPHCGLDTVLFDPASPRVEGVKTISKRAADPSNKVLIIWIAVVCFLAFIAACLFYAVKKELITVTSVLQVLISCVFLGGGLLLRKTLAPIEDFSLQSGIRLVEKGDLFAQLFAFFLRFCVVVGGIVGFIIWFDFWKNVIEMKRWEVLGGVLFQTITLIQIYVVLGILWVRANDISRMGKSDFTVIPILSIFLKMLGETSVAYLSMTGVAQFFLAIFKKDSSFRSIPSVPAFGHLSELGAWELAAIQIMAGFVLLVFYYFLAEILVVVFDIARNIRRISDDSTRSRGV